MTRIILVHGINNQENSAEQIAREWIDAAASVASPAVIAKLKAAEVVAPFYGQALHDWTQARGGVPKAIAQAAGDPGSEEAAFYLAAAQEIAPAVDVTEEQIERSSDPVEQGLPHDRRLLALVRAIEAVSPLQGAVALRILPQAFVYLKRPGVADEIDTIVRRELLKGPAIVVAHSLGTIVTFKLLRQGDCPEVPLYLTAGSPLAIKAVKNAIGPRFERPKPVRRWVNALDKDDAVTLGRRLEKATFCENVENIDSVDNGDDDTHSIALYLKDRCVARVLAGVL